jgi:cytochrome b subunit of formate dehydrogenase
MSIMKSFLGGGNMHRWLIVGVFVSGMALWGAPPKNEDCLLCHGQKDLEARTPRGKGLKLYVTAEELKGTAHETLACVDCHTGAQSFDDAPHWPTPPRAACGDCHADVLESYLKKDIHGRGYQEKNPRAPYCNGCHSGHRILPLASPDSAMSRFNQPDACGACHGSEKLNLEEGITKRNLITRYKSSVHWLAIKTGKIGATCTDCHGFHSIQPSSAPESRVSLVNITGVCVHCHPNQVQAFKNGPHGRAMEHGNHDTPNCTTCHGDHDMASLRSRVGDAKQWAATQVCIWCHSNKQMMARYGLDTTPVESYMKDFHGLTQRGTMGASATCADCHDAHNSLPSSHPQSRMYISNRGATCGNCHGKVSTGFASSFSHKKALQYPGRRLEGIIRILYIILISVAVLFMLGYNLLIWIWAVRRKYREQKNQQHINRLTRYEVWSHMLLFFSFTTLVVTGFALKYPDAFWVRWLFSLGMTEAVRSGIHRLAAITMILDIIVFSFYMIFKKRGRRMLAEYLPTWRDACEAWELILFYLGEREKKPLSPVFGFVEKFEFWALVWGTVIMAVTGLILWFPKAIPGSWPAWIFNVSRLIHYYEAVLAALAILIWHGFHTIWHPDEYPMNTSWLTGYITAEEAQHRFNEKAIAHMTETPATPLPPNEPPS